MGKFLDRADVWGKVSAGTLHTIEAYKVFVASVVSFILQLDPLPDDFPQLEARALRKLFPGPWDWITGDLLKR
eukprot:28099-Pyramimonas_sp.AAC.1